MKKRVIGVVTVARSDSGIYIPILKKIESNSSLKLKLIVAATHLSNEFGMTYRYLEKKGFKIDQKIEMTMSTDTPEGLSKSMGMGLMSFGQLFSNCRPDILMVLGDRYEMLSAVAAAMPFVIPIAHLHGGEATEGLIDEPIRHSITKMSHLHFVATQEYYDRVVQLGEEPWRVNLSGAPSLDSLHNIKYWSKKTLENKIKLSLDKKTLLVTLHPVTLEYKKTLSHVKELLSALDELKMQVVFTLPNADTAGRIIINELENFVKKNFWATNVINFGQEGYFTMLKYATAMVGNSSSGIIESASFKVPVLNIGNRQRGRVHASNVVHVEYDKKLIIKKIKEITSINFINSIKNVKNPYGDGYASEKIIDVLSKVKINDDLKIKRFHNIKVK
jgi:UDP-hydrolysing UDP-N-acetyl-D-glucosamine 2-epimerase